jgi:protein-disulfide isomerase
MRRSLPFIIVVTVGVLTLGSGAVFYRSQRSSVLTLSKNHSASGNDGDRSAHVLGPPNAPLTLEEFGDYQCPPCGNLAEPLRQLEQDFSPKLRIIFRNFPLSVHAHAREAALAAEAAGLQGKFWEMHDLLFRQQSDWSQAADARKLFTAYATLLGLNVERFKKDMEGQETQARVDADHAQGSSLGVKNTPTIFLDNHEVDPRMLNPVALRVEIEAALGTKKPSS